MNASAKRIAKGLVSLAAGLIVLPGAVLCGFGRLETLRLTFAQLFAMFPGVLGDHVRTAFYRFTLDAFPATSRISFGSYFAHRHARVGERVYIGAYCVLGCVDIGDRSQIASGVQVLSGRRQHGRDAEGRIEGAEKGRFERLSVGADCWIGAGAIVMENVGDRSTVGAGAVVTRRVESDIVVVGNPARAISR